MNIIPAISTDYPEDKHVYFSDSRYKAVDFSKEHFHDIADVKSDKVIAFVDGGNADIYSSVNASIHLVRVFAVLFRNNKKTDLVKKEFYVTATAFFENGIKYKAECSDNYINADDLVFDSTDATIKEGVFRANISRIGEIARRFAELKLASELNADIIVLDGTLQSSVTNETKYIERLYETNKIIVGFAKSCSLFTNTGNSAVNAVRKLADRDIFYYFPVVEINHKDHRVDMYFAKLHKNSSFIFRVELFKDVKYNANEIFSLLAKNSVDPVFPGYPYGLYLADRFARVSEREKHQLIIQLRTHNPELKSLDAHNVLDNV